MSDHLSSPPASAGREEEIRARVSAATPRPWKAGRVDMQSYDGATGEAFTNVYADNPSGRWHMGARLPITVARAFDESGRNKADAEFIAHARTDVEWLLDQLTASRSESARLREAVNPKRLRQLATMLEKWADGAGRHNMPVGEMRRDAEYLRTLSFALSPQPKEGA